MSTPQFLLISPTILQWIALIAHYSNIIFGLCEGPTMRGPTMSLSSLLQQRLLKVARLAVRQFWDGGVGMTR